MANKFREKVLKEKYLEAAARQRVAARQSGYSFEMLQALRDMAREDVYPDGHFGDEECNVWSMFHMLAVCGLKKVED